MIYDKSIKIRQLEEIKKHGPALTHFKIARMTGVGGRVLELGCATGYVSRLLRENGCSVVGIELDGEAAEEARQFCDEVIVGDLSNPALLLELDGKFDCIVCGDILEHLPNPDEILSTLRKKLNPGAYVLVSIPNVAYWRMRWDLAMGRFDYQETGLLDITHLRFFTVHSFKRLAEMTGYRITQVSINESGFPGSKLLERIPLAGTISRVISKTLAHLNPNLFSFHSIYRLEPVKSDPEAQSAP